MIERFDLFTIIVLGEVIVGVVTGIAAADRSPAAVVTGVLGLGIGFAYWWSYFDLVAARTVASRRDALATWVLGHFPVTLTIAASGAVMVSMIDHADTGHAPYPASLLLSSSVAVGILALILIATSLADWRDLAPVYRPVSWALGAAAAGALLLGWLAPPPWLHIVLLTLLLGAVWLFGMLTWFSFSHRSGIPSSGSRSSVTSAHHTVRMPLLSRVRNSLHRQLSAALRARVAGPDADARAAAIWLAAGERRFAASDPICRVHNNAAMYAGGIRALLLQSLHPLAMAGVGEHSGYRGDPWGRLQRTAEFIAMTTFGPADGAQRVLDRINKVHGTVSGTAPDGRRYDARDPHLLAWVHIAEIDSFLTAYQRTARTPLTPTEADTYVSQSSWVATELGVPNPPRSVAELGATLASYRPELQVTDGARDAAAFLLREPPLPWAARPGYWMLAAGAVAMLPGYARDLLGLRLPGVLDGIADTLVLQPLGRLGTAAVGWALAEPGDVRNTPQSSAVSG